MGKAFRVRSLRHGVGYRIYDIGMRMGWHRIRGFCAWRSGVSSPDVYLDI
jgi:hypothetical protein